MKRVLLLSFFSLLLTWKGFGQLQFETKIYLYSAYEPLKDPGAFFSDVLLSSSEGLNVAKDFHNYNSGPDYCFNCDYYSTTYTPETFPRFFFASGRQNTYLDPNMGPTPGPVSASCNLDNFYGYKYLGIDHCRMDNVVTDRDDMSISVLVKVLGDLPIPNLTEIECGKSINLNVDVAPENSKIHNLYESVDWYYEVLDANTNEILINKTQFKTTLGPTVDISYTELFSDNAGYEKNINFYAHFNFYDKTRIASGANYTFNYPNEYNDADIEIIQRVCQEDVAKINIAPKLFSAPMKISISKLSPAPEEGCGSTASELLPGYCVGFPRDVNFNSNEGLSIDLVESGLIEFTITHSSKESCGYKATADVNVPPSFNVTLNPLNEYTGDRQVSCPGASDGKIEVNAEIGNGYSHTYSVLQNGSEVKSITYDGSTATSDIISGISAGSYIVLATDRLGCQTTSEEVIISDAPAVINTTDELTNVKDLTCPENSDGQITVTGNVADNHTLTYSIDNGVTFIGDAVFSNLSKGTYTTLVKDENECLSNPVPITVKEPEFNFSVTETSTSCFGSPDGQLTAQLTPTANSASISSIKYSLTDGIFAEPNSNTFSGLSVGTGTVYVQYNSTCSAETTYTITEPAQMDFNVTTTQPSCYGSSDGVLNVVNVSNNQGAVVYSITEPGAGFQTSPSFTNLVANAYTVYVQDEQGCSRQKPVILNEPTRVNASFTETNAITCFGDSDGTLEVSPFGGIGTGYSITWTDNNSTSQTRNNLSAGIYSVNVTDGNGCINEVAYTLSEPDELNVTADIYDKNGFGVSCNGDTDGEVLLLTSGGTPGYTYSWNGEAKSDYESTLAAGNYTVVATDINGCQTQTSFELTQPDVLQLSATVTDETCFESDNGSINLQGQGGTGTYEFKWQGGAFNTIQNYTNLVAGSYLAEIRDSNGCLTGEQSLVVSQPDGLLVTIDEVVDATCAEPLGSIFITSTGGNGGNQFQWQKDGSNYSQTEDITDAQPGSYSITITDAKGCVAQNNAFISAADGPVVQTALIEEPTCSYTADGAAEIAITGGTGAYSVSWPTGTSTPREENLAVGQYTVEVEDEAGCRSFHTVDLTGPEPMTIMEQLQAPSCFDSSDGTITVTASGENNTGFTYQWVSGPANASYANLSEGTYQVNITDAQGCEASFDVFLDAPEELVVSLFDYIQTTCADGSDGSITLESTGGTGNKTYQWNNGQTTNPITNIQGGVSYAVTVTDENGCSKEDAFEMPATEPADLGLTDQEVCEGQELLLSPIITGSSYSWKDGSGNEVSTVSSYLVTVPGTYTLDMISAKGCNESATFTIVENNDLLQTEFLMSTEVNAMDTVLMIDLTTPEPDSIEWDLQGFGTLLHNGQYYAEAQYEQAGTYPVKLTAHYFECAGTRSKNITVLEVQNPEGGRVDNVDFISDFTVYPNPSDGELTVQFTSAEEVAPEIKIHDSQGQVLYEVTGSVGTEHSIDMNLFNLPAGMYYLRVYLGGESTARQLIIN
ncbi:T9SS type A sorting domain-containing protein [Mangrovivirga sp. M17]|uniref:T9SS type A sorting domain-containing protein n=1 Tax=Mangrovivirga halotolerans TaxID=2993936 RepID=A0ABT3RS35_9BACT|nr:T9SS type A sorting domain-containing protein [Mangrovivirga halotolerans]MCX2744387.1 T9SS type A sorting domain-containing protein [Mangrovivirga halotolerans]